MLVRLKCVIPAIVALSACATSDPGWIGSGAEPFDQALAACHAQVAKIQNQVEREAALYRCMAVKGWTRE